MQGILKINACIVDVPEKRTNHFHAQQKSEIPVYYYANRLQSSVNESPWAIALPWPISPLFIGVNIPITYVKNRK